MLGVERSPEAIQGLERFPEFALDKEIRIGDVLVEESIPPSVGILDRPAKMVYCPSQVDLVGLPPRLHSGMASPMTLG
jgi:hypothetical protein